MKKLRNQIKDTRTDKILSTINQPVVKQYNQIISPQLQNNFFISYNSQGQKKGEQIRKTTNLNININFNPSQMPTKNKKYKLRYNFNSNQDANNFDKYQGKQIQTKERLGQTEYSPIKQSLLKNLKEKEESNSKKYGQYLQYRRKVSKSKSKCKNKNRETSKSKSIWQEDCAKQLHRDKINQIYSKFNNMNPNEKSIELINSKSRNNKLKTQEKSFQQKKRKFRFLSINASKDNTSHQKVFKQRYKSIDLKLKQSLPTSQRLNKSNCLKNQFFQQLKPNNFYSKQLSLSQKKKPSKDTILQNANKFILSKSLQYGYQTFKMQRNQDFGKVCLSKKQRPRRLLTHQSLSMSNDKIKLFAIKQNKKSIVSQKQLIRMKVNSNFKDLQLQIKQCKQLTEVGSYQQSQFLLKKILNKIQDKRSEKVQLYRDFLELSAINSFNLNQFQNCVNKIDQVIKLSRQQFQKLEKPNKKLYIMAAVSWSQLNSEKYCDKMSKTTDYLMQCSIQNPQWSQPFDYLGKIYFQNQYYQKAIQCFQQAIKIHQTTLKNNSFKSCLNYQSTQYVPYSKMDKDQEGFFCKRLNTTLNIVQCYKQMNLSKEAIKLLNNEFVIMTEQRAHNISKLVQKGLFQLANLHYFLNQYQMSLQILQKYQRKVEQNFKETFLKQQKKYQIIFMKAHLYYKKDNYYQSMMLLDQILPLVSSFISSKSCSNDIIIKLKNLLLNIVSHMIIIKIDQRDFYQAYHIIERCHYFKINEVGLNIQKQFVFGVVQIMKRKIDQGLQQLQNAYQQLIKLKQINTLNNKKVQHKSLHNIQKPTLQIRSIIQMYLAYGYFCIDNLTKTKSAIESQLELNKLGSFKNQASEYFTSSLNYNLNLCQGILCLKQTSQNAYQKQDNHQCLQSQNKLDSQGQSNIKKAVKYLKNALQYFEKPQPYLYLTLLYVKQLFGFGKSTKYSQSQKKILESDIDFAINRCINLVHDMNNNFSATVFYYRSLVYCNKKKWTLALSDIDEAIQRSEQNYCHYFYLKAQILACCQNFKQAINEVSVAISLNQKNPQNYLLRSKCLQIQGDGNQAFLDLQTYITLKPDDNQIHKYAGHLLFQNGAFQDAILAYSQGNLQTNKQQNKQINFHVYLTRSKTYFLLGDFQSSSKDMLQASEIRFQQKQYFYDYKMMCFLNELISTMEQITSQNELSTDQTQKLLQLLQKINVIYKQGSGVLCNDLDPKDISSRQSKKCKQGKQSKKNNKYFGKIFKQVQIHMFKFVIFIYLKKYEQCIQQLKKCIKLKQHSFFKQNLKIPTQQQQEAEYQEEQNQKKMFVNQMKYNMALTYLKLNNFQLASKCLQSCTIDENTKNYQAWKLLVNQIIHQQSVASIQTYPEVFSIKNKLSKYFPQIKVKFGQNSFRILNICVPYPKVQPPQIMPTFDQNILINFSQNSIQRKPQAPWIVKQKNSIKFTDKIQNFSQLDIQQSEVSYSKKGGLLRQKLQDSDVMSFQQDESYKCLKEKLKLDSDLQKKINKFITK